jgi:hypothetical protein
MGLEDGRQGPTWTSRSVVLLAAIALSIGAQLVGVDALPLELLLSLAT